MELKSVVLLFSLSLVAFHTALLSGRVRRSGTFWHVVDYIWLSAAAIALIFAVIDVQRLRLIGEIARKKADASNQLDGIRMHAMSTVQFLAGTRDKDGGQKGIEWYKKLSSELELGFDSFRWRIFLAQNFDDLVRGKPDPGVTPSSYIVIKGQWDEFKLEPINTNPYLLQDAKTVISHLDEVSQRESEILKLEDKLKSAETSFRLQWPWFLCFALALRITKVTADLIRYKESSKADSSALNPQEAPADQEPEVLSDAP